MKPSLVAAALAVFVLAVVAVRVLGDAGVDNAPILVLAAGLIAGSAVAILR